MPKRNPLFYYLAETQPECVQISSHGVRYAMLPINDQRHPVFEVKQVRCILTEAHVSIYETYERLSGKSDYHFTARLEGEATGALYRLHVYFNTEDVLLGEPSLKDVNNKEQVLDDEMKSVFQYLARAHCLPIIKAHRRNQIQTQTQYLQMVDEGMSSLFESDASETTEEAVDALIDKATKLERMGGEPRRQLLEQFKAFLLSKPAAALAPVSESDDEAEPDFTADSLASTRVPIRHEAKVAVEETISSEMIRQLASYAENVQMASRDREALSLQFLLEYLTLARRCQGESLDAYVWTNEGDLRIIHNAILESHKLCKGRLDRALLTEDAEIYQRDEFQGYADLLDTNVLLLLIKFKKSNALQWVLTHASFDFNALEYMIEGEALSLLEIAVKLNSALCFKVLIENGVSPLFITHTGRPFAYNVMCRKDEYSIVIEQVLGTGEKGIAFYSMLTALLRASFLSPLVSNADRAEMQTFLSHVDAARRTDSEAHGVISTLFPRAQQRHLNAQSRKAREEAASYVVGFKAGEGQGVALNDTRAIQTIRVVSGRIEAHSIQILSLNQEFKAIKNKIISRNGQASRDERARLTELNRLITHEQVQYEVAQQEKRRFEGEYWKDVFIAYNEIFRQPDVTEAQIAGELNQQPLMGLRGLYQGAQAALGLRDCESEDKSRLISELTTAFMHGSESRLEAEGKTPSQPS